MEEDEGETIKVVIVGDSGVGKTSLLMKFLNEKFVSEHQITIGVEFGSKTLNLPGEKPIQMQIWDTAGQEKFRSLVQSFYRGAQVIFLVYSVCSDVSFTNIYDWFQEAMEQTEEGTVYILVGNKNDMEEDRKVQYEAGEEMYKKLRMSLFFETSVLLGQNVERAFVEAAKMVKLRQRQYQPHGIKLEGANNENENRFCAC